jgi:hypothetical protein
METGTGAGAIDPSIKLVQVEQHIKSSGMTLWADDDSDDEQVEPKHRHGMNKQCKIYN